MRLATVCTAVLMWAHLGRPASGHGTPLSVDGSSGVLVANGGLALDGGYATMASDPSEDAGLDFPGATVRTDFPGFDVSGVPEGATLQLELLGRPDHSREGRPTRWLWFWNLKSSLVEEAAGDPDFRFRRMDLQGSLTFDQFTPPAETVLTVTDALTPNEHQHYLRYDLDNSPPAAFGVYGALVRVMSPGFHPSPPILLAFGYGVSEEAYVEGATAINAAAGLAADFDVDGRVTGEDFLLWQRSVGSVDNLAADASLNGVVDDADLAVWRNQFGEVVAYPPTNIQPSNQVAEPATWPGAMWAALALLWRGMRPAADRRQHQRA